jgi:hypothetical protein
MHTMRNRFGLFSSAIVLLQLSYGCAVSGTYYAVLNPNYIEIPRAEVIDSTGQMPVRSASAISLQPPRMELLPNKRVKWYSPYIGSTTGPERVSLGKWKRNVNTVKIRRKNDSGEVSSYLIIKDSLFYVDIEARPYVYVKMK